MANPELGWGRGDETWSFMETLDTLGGETWFRLGDRDLAVHVERTRRLRAGETLSAITADLCARLGVAPRVLPMSDDPVRTRVRTDEGWIDFQDYFVRRRCEPAVHEVAFHGAATARAQPDFLAALADPQLKAVVICPSNPFISIEPILAVPGVREALADCAAPVVAVSPLIGGRAIKGPTAKMMAELGIDAQRRWRGASLRRPDRRLRLRFRRHGPGRRHQRQGHAGADHDDDAGRSRGAGTDGTRRGARAAARSMTPGVWAAVPVKEFAGAKQRLAALLTAQQRQALAAAMLEDVLAALVEAPLAGIMVNTLDPVATELARRYGARVVTDGARDGHTGAVAAMARILAEEGREAMLTVPGDIPRVTAAEIAAVIEARRPAPSLTIVPAHDERGSNAVLCSPPLVMPLRFGDDSFLPHLAAARALGIEPTIVKLPGIGLDIDQPPDVRRCSVPSHSMTTRAITVIASGAAKQSPCATCAPTIGELPFAPLGMTLACRDTVSSTVPEPPALGRTVRLPYRRMRNPALSRPTSAEPLGQTPPAADRMTKIV